MSRKPLKDSDSESPDSDDLESLNEVADPDPDTVIEASAESNVQRGDAPDDDDEDFDDEEFSLDQLSQAYAEVLNSRTGSDADDSNETAVEPDEQDEIDVPNDDIPAGSPAVDDNACCPISPESIIEAILFVGAPSDVKLTSRKVASVLRDVSPKEVTKIVRELNTRYEKEDTAYRIESDGGVFKMILDPKLIDFQKEFFGRNRQIRLSQAAIDVMAIVAYNQPVTREQVDKIRARPSGSVLNQLVRRQLLFVEPGETDPKIKYFATTDRFLDLFQLEEIADLPQSHDVSDMDELAD
jgi:segregation and condensation protein B